MTDALLANGINGHAASPDSIAADSPATPVDNSTSPDIKIDVDYVERESDARNEPIQMKVDAVEDASVLPQAGSPPDPATIPVEPPHGTPPPPPGELLEDVRMAEGQPTENGDVQMINGDVKSPQVNGLPNGHEPAPANVSTSLPAVSSSETAVDSLAAASSPYPNNTTSEPDDDKPPPAKRARKHSDAERASLANTGTPPPASVSPETKATPLPAATSASVPAPAPSTPSVSTFSLAQWRFSTSTVRTLKKMKDSSPFLHPVDPVALNIPHYPSIVKHPMDFSTVDRKLVASNPSKPDPNPANPRYYNAEDFIADVRLIFSNCILFNGPDHLITGMGKRVEAVFDKQIKQMPPPEEPKPVVKKVATPPPPPPPKKVASARRPSTSVPVIRRTEDQANGGRPKREIHPPPPKDLPYNDIPKKTRKSTSGMNDLYRDQFKHCEKVLKELNKKSLYNVAHPFYEPVDWIKLEIPQYPKIIKKPMDLSTIKRKLTDSEYTTPDKFRDDFKLMIKNALTFNPPKNPVHEAAKELDRIFDLKWAELPPLRSQDPSDDEDEDVSDDERARMIADMESQIESMRNNLESIKKVKPPKKEKEKKKKAPPPVASTSKAPLKQAKTMTTSKKKTTKKPINDDDVLSFEQKKDLSDTIGKLDGAKLERVIQIIHEGVPEIRDSTEEIELEIDELPAAVLTKLYNFVIRPMKVQTKRPGKGKGTGTGGLKRKSMDEDVEAAKIRALEERMKLFEGRGSVGLVSDAPPADDSEHSSAESSSESSASDSE
ncbi:Bromodomain-containing protein [Daedalea quercina L-15889]|uniref:Bromodomain-containing protein n=1 Tax=Daedalea quercina L-15889 TaxID=1314783 RepID=A0A165UF34_9APHY|nr:Bromodomain-containing protein [Daedalea quercina L-15889]